MKKYVLLIFLISLGVFGGIKYASAWIYVLARSQLGCHVGGDVKICTLRAGPYAGQLYQVDYENIQNDQPPPDVNFCISTTWGSMTGDCYFFQTRSAGVNVPSGSYRISYNTRTPYRFFTVEVRVQGTWSNDNDFEGQFWGSYRQVENNGATMNPATVQAYGKTATLTGRGAVGWFAFVNDPDKGTTMYNPLGVSDAYNSFTRNYTYTSSTNIGPRTLQWCVHGPDYNANEVDVCENVTVTVIYPTPTVDIKCNGSDGPCSVNYREEATLSWISEYATSCTITGPNFSSTDIQNAGISTGQITSTGNVYTATCTNDQGTATDTVEVNITPPDVSIQCRSSPAGAWGANCTTNYNTNVDVRWSSSNADSCTAAGAWSGSKPLSGTETDKGPIIKATSFTIRCTNRGGTTSRTATANNPPGPTVDLRCFTGAGWTNGPCTVAVSTPARVSWSITAGGDGTTTCETAEGTLWTVPEARPGSQAGPPGESTTPMLIATDTLGIRCRNATSGWGNTDRVVLNRTNTPPVTTGATITEPNYCEISPTQSGGTVSWTYSDPQNDPQSAYHIQIGDATFTTLRVNTGKVLSSSSTYTIPALAWNTNYYARVRTWDVLNAVSPWRTLTACSGPGCKLAPIHWTTPRHRYPSAGATADPLAPAAGEDVTFTSTSTCYNNANNPIACTSLAWTFGDGSGDIGAVVTHAYAAAGAYTATLQAQDAAPFSYTCLATVPIGATEGNLPEWKEVAPQ